MGSGEGSQATSILQHREFTTTRWSVVLRARGSNPEEAKQALEELCCRYWYPLYAFVRRKGYKPEDASDLTQDFFAKLLASDFTARLDPEGGRFRSYLLTALNRFLINQWERGQRQKRGGGATVTSIEAFVVESGEISYLKELAHGETPEHLYQRAWAETLLKRTLDRFAVECRVRSDHRFEVLRPFLATGDEPPELSVAAGQLGLSLPAFKSLLHRFRQRYRQLLLDEVAQTVGSKEDAADELRGLVSALRQS